MGRYLAKQQGEPVPSATPYSNNVPDTDPVVGRYIRRSRGEDVPAPTGRYRSFREQEISFLNSEEGKRIQEDIKRQIEQSQREEEERLKEVQRQAEERIQAYETATQREQRMFGETGTSSLKAELKDLGYTEEQIKEMDYKGIDIEAVNKYREERAAFEKQFGTAMTTEMFPEQDPKTLKEYGKMGLDFLNSMFLEKQTITAPFQNKLDPNRENVGPQVYGKVQEFAGEIVSSTLDSLVRTLALGTAEIALRTKAVFSNKPLSETEMQLPFGKGWIFNEMDVTADNKIRPYMERSLDQLAELNRLSPDTPIKNNLITTLDQTIIPLLDATIVLDILNAAARPLIMTVGTKEIGAKYLPSRTIDGVEIVKGVGPRRIKVPVRTETNQLVTAYQVLGFSRDEIANIGKMTPYEQSQVMANRMRERAAAILKNEFEPTPGAEGLKPQQTPKEMLDAMNALKAEGSLTPEQEMELYRLNSAVYTVLGMELKNGVVGIPKMMQFGQEMAMILSQPLKSFADAEAAFQRALRLRARAAGEEPFKFKLGLTIDDVSGGAGKKSVDNDIAEQIDPILQKAKEPIYDGIGFVFDSRSNSLLIGEGAGRWDDLPLEAKQAIIAITREQGVNLGKVYDLDPEFGPREGEIEYIVQGFTPDELALQQRIRAEEAKLRDQKKAVEEADNAYVSEGLSADDPLVRQFAEEGFNQSMLTKALTEISQITTGRSVPNILSRQLLNTPIESNIVPNPLRKSSLPEGNATAKAIIDSNNGLVAQMADQARAMQSAADFVRRFGFLQDANNLPDVKFRGTGIFTNIGTPKQRLRDLANEGVLNIDDIKKVIRAELPSSIVQMTAPLREPKLAQTIADIPPKAIADLIKPGFAGDRIRDFVYERSRALSRLTSSQAGDTERVLSELRADTDKPNIPLFLLTKEGRAVLLSQNRQTEEVIAAAKMAGVETIPGYLVDISGGLDELRTFLKENNMTLKDFALEARSLEPKVASGKTAKKPMTAEMRQEAGLLSGRLTRVGTSEENSIIINKNYLRQDLPANEPVLYNGLIAREQWDIPKLTVIGEGSSRVVFEVGKDALLKVAKTELGKVQNLMSYNIHAWRQGLIPKQFAGGDGWILVERHDALAGPALKHFEDFVDAWKVYAAREISSETGRPVIVDKLLKSWMSGADQGVLTTMMVQMAESKLDVAYFDTYMFKFLNEWRQSPAALLAQTKDGKPFYNWTEFSRYNTNLDIFKEDSWGVRPDGTMVLIDEGSIYREALGVLRKNDETTWREFYTNFDEATKKSQKVKQELKDSDGHRMFGFAPLPYFEEDEEGNYNFDIWKSMVFTALGSVAVGGELPFRKGKGKKGKVAKPEAQTLREELLPQTTAPLPGAVKGAVNADVYVAKTGEPFGGVFPQTANFKGVTPQGIPSLDKPGELLPPLGDAGYVFTDADVAANFNTDGKVTHFISNADNPIVINTDKDLRALAKAAGIQEPDIMQVTEAMNKKNIDALRAHIESLGHDGVIVAMDPRKGKIDLLDRYFEFNQFINFNKGNFKPTTGPNTPSVTVTKKTRAGKLQRQIMRAIDPPKNRLEIDEMKLLKKRLQTLNLAIKEGKKLGWSEARVSITNRLNNIWEFRMEKANRNRDLQLLRQRILDREKLLIKRELVDYAEGMLPSKVDREFLAQRGKLIKSIATLETRSQLQKAFTRIDRMRTDTEKRLLIAEIKKTVGRWADSPSVSADYRKMIKQLFETVDLTKRRTDTIQRIAAMRDYVNRTINAGGDVLITEQMQKEMELLLVKGVDQLTVGDLKNFMANVETLIEFGKAKRRTYRDLMKLRRGNILNEIADEGTKPLSNREIADMPANVGEELTKQQQFNNWWKEQQNKFRRTSAAIQPMDYVFDRLDGGKLSFDGPMYRHFRDEVNIRYNAYLQQKGKYIEEMSAKVEELGLKDGNFERIGVYMQSRRPEGRARLISMGYTNKMIDDVELTPREMEWVNYADELLNKERPILARIARDVFNKEFNVLEEMFPMIADFKKMGEENYHIMDMFGDKAANLTGKRTKVKPGTIESRKPGAEGAIKIHALEVINQHLDNTFYMEQMAEHIKTLGDVVNAQKRVANPREPQARGSVSVETQPILEEQIGDVGLQLAKSYVDLLARKGGAEGQQTLAWISWLNRNVGAAELAWKLGSMLIQPTAIFNTAAVIGTPALNGLREIITSSQARNFVLDNMPQIRNRIGDDLAFRIASDFSWIQKWNQKGWYGLQYLDRLTASGGAMGAYRKYLRDHNIPFDWNKPNQDAINYAQRIINTTQSSSDWKDAAPMLGSGWGVTGNREMNRIIGKFQSFVMTDFQVLNNYVFRTAAGKTDRSRLNAAWAFMMMMMGVMATVQVRRTVYQGEDALVGKDPEDDRRLEDSFAKKMALEALGKFPFVSQFMSVAIYESEPFPVLTPVVRGTRGLWAMTESAYGGDYDKTFFKGTIDMLAGITGAFGVGGTGQLRSIARAWTDVLMGDGESGGGSGGSGQPQQPRQPEAPRAPQPPQPPRP